MLSFLRRNSDVAFTALPDLEKFQCSSFSLGHWGGVGVFLLLDPPLTSTPHMQYRVYIIAANLQYVRKDIDQEVSRNAKSCTKDLGF